MEGLVRKLLVEPPESPAPTIRTRLITSSVRATARSGRSVRDIRQSSEPNVTRAIANSGTVHHPVQGIVTRIVTPIAAAAMARARRMRSELSSTRARSRSDASDPF